MISIKFLLVISTLYKTVVMRIKDIITQKELIEIIYRGRELMPNLKRGILRGLKGARGLRTVYGRGFDPLSSPLQSLELKTFLLVMNECDTSHCVFDRLRNGSMLTKKSALTVQNDCSNSISDAFHYSISIGS